jgi:hypothetical protein
VLFEAAGTPAGLKWHPTSDLFDVGWLTVTVCSSAVTLRAPHAMLQIPTCPTVAYLHSLFARLVLPPAVVNFMSQRAGSGLGAATSLKCPGLTEHIRFATFCCGCICPVAASVAASVQTPNRVCSTAQQHTNGHASGVGPSSTVSLLIYALLDSNDRPSQHTAASQLRQRQN